MVTTRSATTTTTTTATPHAHGTRWWLNDAQEAGATDRFAGQRLYACYMAAIVVGCLGVLWFFPAECVVAPAHLAASPFVDVSVLLAFRCASAALVLFVVLRRILTEAVVAEETLDRRPMLFRSRGLWRMCGLTQWQFLTIGLYFTASAYMTFATLDAEPAWVAAPSRAACAIQSLFGVAFGLAMMTTVIVTFVLVPGKLKNGTDASHFFHFDELVQHNANTLLLSVDLLLGGLHARPSDLPYCLLFGSTYVCFHHFWRYPRTRTLLYFFLNWQWGKKAPAIVVALLSAMAAFFLVGWLISEVLRERAWGPPVVLLGNFLIMRLRHPPPGAYPVKKVKK